MSPEANILENDFDIEVAEKLLSSVTLPNSDSFQDDEVKIEFASLKTALEKENFNQVLAIDTEASSQEVYIGCLDPEDIIEKQNAAREACAVAVQKRKIAFEKSLADLEEKEKFARRKVVSLQNEIENKHIQLHKYFLNQQKQNQAKLLKIFHRKESKLRQQVKKLGGIVQEEFGQFELFPNIKKRKYVVNWSLQPCNIQIRLGSLRSCKDKLEKGYYVLILCLYNRLGGSPLGWTSSNIDRLRQKVTRPVFHNGTDRDFELILNQSVFLACPPETQLKFATTITFQLVKLRNRNQKRVEKIVGWGAFPLVNSDRQIIDGYFRVPFLRGKSGYSLEKYSDIEKSYSANLDNWLCNLVFKISRVPTDHDDPITGEVFSKSEFDMDFSESFVRMDTLKNIKHSSRIYPDDTTTVKRKSKLEIKHMIKFRAILKYVRSRHDKKKENVRSRPQNIRKQQPLNNHSKISSDDFSYEAIANFRKQYSNSANLVNSTSYDKYRYDVQHGTVHHKIGFCGFRLAILWEQTTNWRYMNILDTCSLIICVALTLWSRLYLHYLGQFFYIKYENAPIYAFSCFADRCELKVVSVNMPLLKEVIFISVGPVSVYLGFLACIWLVLISRKLLGHTPKFMYTFTALFGMCSVFDPLLILIVDLIHGRYDCSVFATDTCFNLFSNYDCLCIEGDAFKLYRRFLRDEKSGLGGILLTILIYFMFLVPAVITLYVYLMGIHLDGRINDLYRRLCGSNVSFFVPHDCEVSINEIESTCYLHRKVKWIDRSTDYVAIYNSEIKGKDTLYRQFFRLEDGTLLEMIERDDITLGDVN